MGEKRVYLGWFSWGNLRAGFASAVPKRVFRKSSTRGTLQATGVAFQGMCHTMGRLAGNFRGSQEVTLLNRRNTDSALARQLFWERRGGVLKRPGPAPGGVSEVTTSTVNRRQKQTGNEGNLPSRATLHPYAGMPASAHILDQWKLPGN